MLRCLARRRQRRRMKSGRDTSHDRVNIAVGDDHRRNETQPLPEPGCRSPVSKPQRELLDALRLKEVGELQDQSPANTLPAIPRLDPNILDAAETRHVTTALDPANRHCYNLLDPEVM